MCSGILTSCAEQGRSTPNADRVTCPQTFAGPLTQVRMKRVYAITLLLAVLVTPLTAYTIVCTKPFPAIPEVELIDVPLIDAIDFLRQKTKEIDDFEPNPERKGIRFVIDDHLSASDLAKTVTVRRIKIRIEDVLSELTTQTKTAFVNLKDYVLITSLDHARELRENDGDRTQE